MLADGATLVFIFKTTNYKPLIVELSVGDIRSVERMITKLREMDVPTYEFWREKILSDVQGVQTQPQMLCETLNFVEETEDVRTDEIIGELRD
ncbi:hypothetical protein BJ742DRAFT_769690 [Cladochytrium replicatum]|nr:hypothetical protein BJ742DRAFT_769690 [Cladochytrium replicatum]